MTIYPILKNKKINFNKMGYGEHFQANFNNRPETCYVGGKLCSFRSQLEKGFAEYLELLKRSGEIKDWFFESTKFVFADDSYLVDFEVRNNDNTFEYYECKGRFDDRAKRKLKLLNKYRPEVQLTLVFRSKADARKVSKKQASFCKRVCIFKGLKGLEDYQVA